MPTVARGSRASGSVRARRALVRPCAWCVCAALRLRAPGWMCECDACAGSRSHHTVPRYPCAVRASLWWLAARGAHPVERQRRRPRRYPDTLSSRKSRRIATVAGGASPSRRRAGTVTRAGRRGVVGEPGACSDRVGVQWAARASGAAGCACERRTRSTWTAAHGTRRYTRCHRRYWRG